VGDLEKWEFIFCRGEYGKVYFEVLEYFKEILLARGFLDLTLCCPDIKTFDEDIQILLENTLPPLVYEKSLSVNVSNESNWNSVLRSIEKNFDFNLESQLLLFEELPFSFELILHEDSLFGNQYANYYQLFYTNSKFRFSRHFKDRIEKGLLRTLNFSSVSEDGWSNHFRPYVEVFSNRVFLNFGDEVDYSNGDAVIAFLSMKSSSIIHSICMTILYGNNIEWDTLKIKFITDAFKEKLVYDSENFLMNHVLSMSSPERLSFISFPPNVSEYLYNMYDWS
jgi:hypothetical protein